MELEEQPSSIGKKRERSTWSKLKEAIEDTKSSLFFKQVLLQLRENLPTLEYLLQSRKKICNDNKNSSEENTQVTNSSQISGLESISKGKGFAKWWNKSCEEMSKKLWYPTKIDSVDSPLTSLSSCVKSTERSSWSKITKYKVPSKNLQKICFPSSTFSHVGDMDSEDTKKSKGPYRARKIRMYPSQEQEKVLNIWFRDARKIYNRVVHYLRTENDLKLNKFGLRNRFSTETEDEFPNTPSKIKHQAVFDAYEAYHSNLEKLKKAKKMKKAFGKKKKKKKRKKQKGKAKGREQEKKKGKRRPRRRKGKKARKLQKKRKYPFCVSFKSKRRTSDSIGFQKDAVKGFYSRDLGTRDENYKVRIFPTFMKDDILVSKNKMVNAYLDSDPRIQKIFGRFYFIIPEEISIEKDDATLPQLREVALDPGVRKFQAFYDPQGSCGFIGDSKNEDETNKDGEKKHLGDIYRQTIIHFSRDRMYRKRMQELEEMYGALSSDEKQTLRGWYRKKKYKLRNAWRRLRLKASNRMDDFHWHTIKFLLDNYDVIYIPKFQVQNMTRRGFLNQLTRKRMLYMKHYSFRQKLIYKASTMKNKFVVECNEHSTSKTCGICGQKMEIGSSETFGCVLCNLWGPERDLHGARNIFLKVRQEPDTLANGGLFVETN